MMRHTVRWAILAGFLVIAYGDTVTAFTSASVRLYGASAVRRSSLQEQRRRSSRPLHEPLRMASGVDLLPLQGQALIFAGVMSSVTAGGLAVAGPILDGVQRRLDATWFDMWTKSWPLLGVVYALAGCAHFSSADAFRAIYPPAGTWGMWFLPGTAEFHVQWTGAAEILGGVGLLLGGVVDILPEDSNRPDEMRFLTATSALGLFVLTLAVVS